MTDPRSPQSAQIDRAAISGEGRVLHRQDTLSGAQLDDTHPDHLSEQFTDDNPPLPVTTTKGRPLEVVLRLPAKTQEALADSWAALDVSVPDGNPAVQVLGANPTRRKATIRHDGTASVELRVAPSKPQLDGGGGFTLTAAAGWHELTVEHTGPIYAINSSGTDGALYVTAEYDSQRPGLDIPQPQ